MRSDVDSRLKDVCKLDAGINAKSIQDNFKASGLSEPEWLIQMQVDIALYQQDKKRLWFDADGILKFLEK